MDAIVGDKKHGYRFRYHNEPGWHRLGESYDPDEKPTAEKAADDVTHGVEVVKVPIEYTIDGTTFKSNRQFNIVRKPIPDDPKFREFGIVGSSWKLESYAKCAKVFNKLTETYPVETVGLIQHGSTCFICLRADDWDVSGDKMAAYIVIKLSMQPGESHQVIVTHVRVVCKNTLEMAIGNASLNIKIPHQADSLEQMNLAADIIAGYKESQEKTKQMCEAMAGKSLTVDEAYAIFKAAYPTPSMPRKLKILHASFPNPEDRTTYVNNLDADEIASIKVAELRYQQLLGRTESLRELAMEKYSKFDEAFDSPESKKFEGTAWAAYNAVAEVADWREGRNQDESAFAGSRALEKTRAFKAATQVVEADATFQELLAKK
jgi:hypothetical protein